MKRKEFIKTCGFTCLGAVGIFPLLQGCVSSKSVNASILGENMIVPLEHFQQENNSNEKRAYLVVRNKQLRYPIYVFRFSDLEYSALFLRCTHQGNEITPFGEKLVCPAHGSEFDNKGLVTQGPASVPLRSFPVSIDHDTLIISLKAV